MSDTYEMTVRLLDEGHSRDGGGRTWVHCDQLTLHRPGVCEFCDKYAPDAQHRRIERGVPFSGEPGAPDALFRPDETIKRWPGNRPTAYTIAVPVQFVCSGGDDGSRFCCARKGCHPVCTCTL